MESRIKRVVGPVARISSPLWALALGGCLTGRATFREITVERINVVDANGRTVMTLSNRQRIPGPVVEGKTFPVSVSDGRENLAGLVFLNQDGDEMGGLLFNSFRLPDGRAAGIGHLSFDRFRDNQVLALQYKENRTGVMAGLTLYDRPATGALRRSLDLIEESRGAPTEREAEIRRILAEMKAACKDQTHRRSRGRRSDRDSRRGGKNHGTPSVIEGGVVDIGEAIP